MDEDLAPVIMVGAFVAAAAGLIAIGVYSHRRMIVALRAFAAQHGFDVVGADTWLRTPRLTTVKNGRRTEIYTFTTGSGKSRTHWVALAVRPATPSGLTFVLKPQGFGTKLAELFGAKEIQVGDPAFDAAWFIQTNRADYLRAALLPEIRAKLTAARASGAGGAFKFETGELVYAEQGSISEAVLKRFATLFPVCGDLVDLAEVAG